MKLLFCDSCGDVRKLGYKVTSCACGKVKAKYLEDGWHAEHNGEGFLLGIDNNTFLPTVQRYRYNAADRELPKNEEPSPYRFEAWLMVSNPRVTINKELTNA